MKTQYNMILEVCKGHEGTIFSEAQISDMIKYRFEITPPTLRLADCCYNRTNEGINFDEHIFIRSSRGKYKYVGENYAYTGNVYWQQSGKKERIVGKWKDGKYFPLEGEVPNNIIYPDDIVGENIIEGSKKQIEVNSYERNATARKECLKVHGYDCSVCKFNFEKKYGEIGKNFIHVHHIKPLSEIGEEYKVDPSKDLIPVCPNCHVMLHTENPPISIQKMKNLLVSIGGK